MADKLCETCAAWDNFNDESGWCRRHVPVFIPNLDSNYDNRGGWWPITSDTDWCCEWLPKTPEPGEC